MTPSARGSPTTTRCAIRSRTASTTASWRSAGTITRRIAVHFCPAFTVISVTTEATNAVNSGLPGSASGPSRAAFSESVSAVRCTPRRITASSTASTRAVEAEPVKPTASRTSRKSRNPRAGPLTSWSDPSGRRSASTIARTAASAR